MKEPTIVRRAARKLYLMTAERDQRAEAELKAFIGYTPAAFLEELRYMAEQDRISKLARAQKESNHVN
jgi:hypothetical protein